MLERIHLAIVQEVEKQGTLTAAADVLCVTQSALSHSMKKLEQHLGTDVWLREFENGVAIKAIGPFEPDCDPSGQPKKIGWLNKLFNQK